MNPRRTPDSNTVFRLVGGTEDNDLWVEKRIDDHHPVIVSVWELTGAERDDITHGANIELTVWGDGTPPVALRCTSVALGKDGTG